MTRYAPLVLLIALGLVFVAPWPLPAFLALAVSPVIPVAPLALGLMFDALYRAPGLFPLASALGALASALALLVRKRLAPGIIAS
jgi:hypothetical protein